MGTEIARGQDSKVFQVRYLQNAGWELEPYQANLSFKHERNEAASGTLLPSNGLLAVASSHVEVPLFSKSADLNGYDPGWYDANVVAQGDVFLQKRISGSDSTEQRLSADQDSFPSAIEAEGENMPMDRVAKTTHNHDQAPIIFSFIAPSSFVNVPHKIAQFHFNGPAGAGKKWKGRGQYQLTFYGDGKCILAEKVRYEGEVDDEWLRQHSFQYAPAYSVSGQSHRIEIRPVPAGKLLFAKYGAIVFDVQVNSQTDYAAGPGLLRAGTTQKPGRSAQSTYVLANAESRSSESPPATVNAPARVDVRRDLRIPFQLSKLVYRTSGHLVDDVFSLDFFPKVNAELTLALIGNAPSGTSITPRLFRADDDTEIPSTGSDNGVYTFDLPFGMRHFYPRFDFAGTSETTPILEGYQVRMDQLITTLEPGEFEPEGVGDIPYGLTSVSITGSEADPSQESMRVTVEDLGGSFDRLSVRGRMLAQLETEYDPEDEEKRCVLFRGHMVDNEGEVRGYGHSDTSYPSRKWKSYDLAFLGVWKRLSESLSSVRFDWHGPDPTAAVGPDGVKPPYKATTAIDTMLGWAGFPPEMRNIPDIDIRLYPSATNDLFIEPLVNLCDYIARIARDYLAMWLTFDANSGEYGKWTLVGTPTAPYDIKAAFVTDIEVDPGVRKLSHSLLSYNGEEVEIPTAFIRRDAFKVKTRPLEGNRLVVTGTGLLAGAPPDMEKLTQVVYNFDSCNFLGLDESHPNFPDPNHPDYIGYDVPIYVVDPSLQTLEAVNIVTRRVYEIACKSTRIASFMAPLLLIDHEIEEGRKRPLRFYDPVTVTHLGVESTWLVRNVNPSYVKDGLQWAIYELEAPREAFLIPE